MATPKGRYDLKVIMYQQAGIAESKEMFYMELSNTITNLNDNKNTPLSNVMMQEAVSRVMIEDGEGKIIHTNNVTADTFSIASISQREISNAKFPS